MALTEFVPDVIEVGDEVVAFGTGAGDDVVHGGGCDPVESMVDAVVL